MSIITRRKFLAATGATAIGTAALAGPKFVFAAPGDVNNGDTLVVIFLRGGADGLSLTPPYGYSSYRDLRPNIAVPPPGQQNGALPLTKASSPGALFPTGIDGVVGLHPALQPIYDTLWKQGKLAIVPATGMPDSETTNRSHFEAEKYLERGSASPNVSTGWLARLANNQEIGGPAGVIQKSNKSVALRGTNKTVSVNRLANSALNGFSDATAARATLSALTQGEDSIAFNGRRVLEVVDSLAKLDSKRRDGYPNNKFGNDLSDVATLFQANVGLQIAALDNNGWDHHKNINGQLPNKARELASGLNQLAQDTNNFEGVTVVVVSEFGRTVKQNGSGGVDHGRAATHFVMGSGIQGGVFGDDYPTALTGDAGNAVPVITDYRKVLMEVVQKRTAISEAGISSLFPTYNGDGQLGLAK